MEGDIEIFPIVITYNFPSAFIYDLGLMNHRNNQHFSRNALDLGAINIANQLKSNQTSTRFMNSTVGPIKEIQMENCATMATQTPMSFAPHTNDLNVVDYSVRGKILNIPRRTFLTKRAYSCICLIKGFLSNQLFNGEPLETPANLSMNFGLQGSPQLPQIYPHTMAYTQRIFDGMSTSNMLSDNGFALPTFDSVNQLNSTHAVPFIQRPYTAYVVHPVMSMQAHTGLNLTTQAVVPVAGPPGAYETMKLHVTGVPPVHELDNNESVHAIFTNQQASALDLTIGRSQTTNASFVPLNEYQCKFCQKRCRSQSTFIVHLRSHTG